LVTTLVFLGHVIELSRVVTDADLMVQW